MKKVFSLTAAALFILLASSCNSSEKLLCRTWKLVEVELDETTVNITKEQKPLVIQMLKDSSLFTFNKDHSYITKLPQRIEKGTWSFSKKNDTLYTQNAFSKINTLTDSRLDMNTYNKDGAKLKVVLAPVQK